ncbi:7,8-didemethyl-8-hydroxy-5-deazariboflavin synthase CofG [[Eubacterium] cellulosolvens]
MVTKYRIEYSSIPYSNNKIDEILNKAQDGVQPDKDEAILLIKSHRRDLKKIISAASDIREKVKDRQITYSKNVFIPLTNMCRNECAYCGFRKKPTDDKARILTAEEVMNIVRLGEEAGCKEALFVMGERPEIFEKARSQLKKYGYSSIINYLKDMCEMVIDNTQLIPHSNLGILNKDELKTLKQVNASLGLMLESSSRRLFNRGEPHQLSPGKDPDRRLKTIEKAGNLKIPFTTGILIGIGETLEERIDSLFHIKRLNDKYHHIQELIIQNFYPQPNTAMQNYPEPQLDDIVKTIAISRIIFQGSINIQAPPNLLSGTYQSVLEAGINDWGGISNITYDYVNPHAAWPDIEDLKVSTINAGFTLKMRLPIYPEYIRKISGFLPKKLKHKITSQVDDEGFVREDKF